jgi:hypothetical protein
MAGVKVKVHEGASPSAQLVKEALAEVVVTDAKGRSIKLRRPGPFAPFKLAKIMGESAENRTLMRMYLPMLFVSERVWPPS